MLRQASPTARRLALRNRLETLRDFHGVTGTFGFSACDHAGLTPNAFELYRIEGGRFAIQPPAAPLVVTACPPGVATQ
jgi:hypothetical protein